eukprot:6179880-Pleurochrysis_carterae.AAC.1
MEEVVNEAPSALEDVEMVEKDSSSEGEQQKSKGLGKGKRGKAVLVEDSSSSDDGGHVLHSAKGAADCKRRRSARS